jgi:hypothetical protein
MKKPSNDSRAKSRSSSDGGSLSVTRRKFLGKVGGATTAAAASVGLLGGRAPAATNPAREHLDPQIRSYFGKRYSDYSTKWVRGIIEVAAHGFEETKKVHVREDARFFMLLNFTEMIAHPLEAKIETAVLQRAVDQDVRLLLTAAASHDPTAEEISGHAIVDALSWTWAQLHVMKWDLWG